MIDQVMEIFSAILCYAIATLWRRRRGLRGKELDFFDVRYPLAAGLKVAIIIPTRTTRSWCGPASIASNVATAISAMRSCCIDHESDDSGALAYFDSIPLAGDLAPLQWTINSQPSTTGLWHNSMAATRTIFSAITISRPSKQAGWSACWSWARRRTWALSVLGGLAGRQDGPACRRGGGLLWCGGKPWCSRLANDAPWTWVTWAR